MADHDAMPGLSDDIRAQMRETYLDEASGLIDALETALLALERDPANGEAIDEGFRAAHTIKGSGAAVGFAEIAAFTHELENSLDRLRQHELALTPPGLTALLGAVDMLRALLDAARDGLPAPATDRVIARVRDAFAASATPAAAAGRAVEEAPHVFLELTTLEPAEADALRAHAARGDTLLQVWFTLPEDAFARGLDPLRLLDALASEATLVRVTPLLDRLPPLAELDPGACYLGFSCLVATRDRRLVAEVFEFCPDGSQVEITTIGCRDGGQDIVADAVAAAAPTAAEPAAPWQAADDWKLIGEILVEADAVTPEQVEDALAKQRALAAAEANRTIRVKQSRVDGLINLVGELVTARNALLHLQHLVETRYELPELARRMKDTTATINRGVSQLQADMLSLRMVPVETVFQRLPRTVRDVATAKGRQVALHISGKETEIDKTVGDALVDPLIHIVRNAVDHGIESPEERAEAGKPAEGSVWVDARREGNSVVIEVRDDGAGIDPERLRRAAVAKGVISEAQAARLSDQEALELIFAAGFSTAGQVSDISGRGVGMDVARQNVLRMGGTIGVQSTAGIGTSVRLQLPLSLSVFRALVVRAGGEAFALPLDAVADTAAVLPSETKTVYGHRVATIRGELVGLVSLAEAMDLRAARDAEEAAGEEGLPVVVIEAGSERLGLVVDELDQPQEIMVKPLEGYLTAGGAIAGASVMGDGRVALVLEPSGVLQLALGAA